MSRKPSNLPKKTRSAFLLFCKDERENIKKNKPNTKFEEFGRQLGVMWSEVSSEKKKKYEEKAKADKDRYETEVKEYIAKGGSKDDLKKKDRKGVNKKTKKDPKAPKRASTAYIFFSKEMRTKLKKENQSLKFGELGKLIGEKWKDLDEADKKKYYKLAEEDKQRWEKEKEEYKPPEEESNEEEGEEAEVKKPTKTSKAAKQQEVEEEEEESDESSESE